MAYLILHDPASKAGIESAEGCEAKSNKKSGKKHDRAIDGGAPGGGGAGIGADERGAVALVSILGIRG